MVYSGIQIDGAKEFRRAAKKAGVDLKNLRGVHLSVAGIVVNRAKGWVPKRTGNLGGSIRAGATQRAGIVRAGNNRKTKAGVPYANPIHWGWHGTDALGRRHNIRANPFLSYSAQNTESQWLKEYNDKIEKLLDGFYYF